MAEINLNLKADHNDDKLRSPQTISEYNEECNKRVANSPLHLYERNKMKLIVENECDKAMKELGEFIKPIRR
jgi:hypothetical protein